MQTQIYKADSRGQADYEWLKANYSFSFANYYNPQQVHFGVLRVLNDDVIAASGGFDTHPHDNMEIITIPLSGQLAHKDSMGHVSYIKSGEVQVMSAGKGIFHSEFNGSDTEALNLFQIWLFPNLKNVEPRYQKISIADVARKNELYQILSPSADDQGVWIYQDAWFHMGDLDSGWSGSYQTKKEGNGIYLMVIEGDVKVGDALLHKRDAIGITNVSEIEISADSNARLLIMDVPMN